MLSPRQICDFFDLGFVVIKDLFKEQEIMQARSALDRLQKKASQLAETTLSRGTQFVVEKGRIKRIVWCLGEEPQLRFISHDERILKPVSQLLGQISFDHIICQAHFKLPGDEVDFDWHQDSEHRRYGTPEWQDVNQKGSYVQTMLAIDPINLENGPVKFVKYSTRRGHLGLQQLGDKRPYIQTENIATPLLSPGSLVLFGPYVIHGSEPNKSKGPRRVFLNGFSALGANHRVYPGCGKGLQVSLREAKLGTAKLGPKAGEVQS